MTPSWPRRLRHATRLRQDARRQVIGERFLPETAQREHAQIQADLPRLPAPTHPRTLETLREHRLTRRLRHAAAQRQATPTIPFVIHPAAVTAQVAICLPKRRPLRLR